MGSFCEDHFDDDVDYYDGDIKDDAEAEGGDIEDDVEAENEDVGDDAKVEDEDAEAKRDDYNEYPYERPLDWSCITGANSKSGP